MDINKTDLDNYITGHYGEDQFKSNTETNEEMQCPFCKDTDFDLIGLKIQLERGFCEIFENIDTGALL